MPSQEYERELQELKARRELKALRGQERREAEVERQRRKKIAFSKTFLGRLQSRGRKVESKFNKAGRTFAKQRVIQLAYAAQVKRPLYGRAGRPKGTFKSKYAAFGGVYNYRKAMAQSRRLRSYQAQRESQLTPEEQYALQQLAARKRASQVNPENRVIPDTSGYSFIGSYNDEINGASNIIP